MTSDNHEEYTRAELGTLDLDWFAVDKDGHLAHFASGGEVLLPKTVTKSERTILQDYFRHQASNHSVSLESLGWEIPVEIDPTDCHRKKRFLESYSDMACRGLFSYSTPGNSNLPAFYFRVTIPNPPLFVHNLPLEIRPLIEKVVLPEICFESQAEIHPSDLGECV